MVGVVVTIPASMRTGAMFPLASNSFRFSVHLRHYFLLHDILWFAKTGFMGVVQ